MAEREGRDQSKSRSRDREDVEVKPVAEPGSNLYLSRLNFEVN